MAVFSVTSATGRRRLAFSIVRATACLALLIGLAPVPALAGTVPMVVECPECPAEASVRATLHWAPEILEESLEETPEPAPPEGGSVEISIPGTVEVDLTADVLWSVTISADGWWSPGARVVVQPPPQAVEPMGLSVVPAGEIEGRARLQDGSPVSGGLTVEHAPTPGKGKGGPGGLSSKAHVSDCEVDDDGRFRCRVPAGLLDLGLRAPGAASEFLWGVAVGHRKVVSLGELRFVPGASVVGFLTAENARHLPRSAWAELVPQTAAPAGSGAEGRLQRLIRTAVPDARGLFQFEDLRAGTYRLIAGGEGFVETSLSPIRVLEGRESRLGEPLLLRRPARLEVWISPPVDVEGRPWRLRLYPRDSPRGRLREPRAGPAGVDGRWLQTELPPGSYNLAVEGGEQGRWHEEEVEITGPETSIEISLPLVQVAGRVSLDGEPIPSLLMFGGRRGSPQVWLRSNEEGEFEGVLPREGEWPLEVVLHEDGTVQELDPVEVFKTSDGSPTVLEIKIPDTLLAGEVSDAEGEPVVGARVTARRADRPSVQASDANSGTDGEFAFRGLAEGDYLVSARRLDPTRPLGLDSESPGVEVTVREDRPVRDVELVLEGRKTVRGVVLSSAGPVAGALVKVRPRTKSPAASTYIDERVTGPTGEVKADVPGSTIGVTVIVDPPGFPTSFGHIPLAGNGAGTLRFQVAEAGGRLVVILPRSVQEGWPGSPILHHEGSFVPLPALGVRGRQERSTDPELGEVVRWTHPSLAYGSYTLCPSGLVDQRCSSGYLQPDGELVLRAAPR